MPNSANPEMPYAVKTHTLRVPREDCELVATVEELPRARSSIQTSRFWKRRGGKRHITPHRPKVDLMAQIILQIPRRVTREISRNLQNVCKFG